ncbi:ABC transporter ATP-binding protein, partial [bacterium]|nr:ABC transporter ATP-binding protein [bacterium]
LGLDQPIEPQGSNLPRSIAQLILIARSVSRKPKLLLLEDALEHLDDSHRKCVIDYITDRKQQWTLISASTDAYLASKSDYLILMDGGTIAKKGSYDELKSSIDFNRNGHA